MAQSVAAEWTTGHRTVSEAVVAAVAELTDSDPLSLEPLYHAVDPDALDALLQDEGASRSPQCVEFSYADCDVTVSDGVVTASNGDAEVSTVVTDGPA